MRKKRRRKTSETVGVKSIRPDSGSSENPGQNQPGDDATFALGVLPDRDLKKNLGCG